MRTIPGCERLETTGENTYAMTVTAGVAAIRGTYDGTCALSDLKPHESLVMRLPGRRCSGHHRRHRRTSRFAPTADGGTRVAYDADAVVGGMVGGVGQRMLGSVSKRMAGEFFGNVAGAIGGGPVAAPRRRSTGRGLGDRRGRPGVHRPARPASSQQDFLKGIAVGAGLVLLGVIAGGLFGRRRR